MKKDLNILSVAVNVNSYRNWDLKIFKVWAKNSGVITGQVEIWDLNFLEKEREKVIKQTDLNFVHLFLSEI